MGAGLYHLHGYKSDRWPPTSPMTSQLDGGALGAQRFHLRLSGGSFGTSRPRHHCPLLPSLGVGRQGLPRWWVSHLCLWRTVYCSGRGWRSFCLDLRWVTSHSGQGWMTFHPGSRWIFFRLDQGLVGLRPVTSQRLQLLESQFGLTSVCEVNH